MDLLKLVDKQKLQEGGVVTQSADDFKKAADLAVKKPLNTPDPKNFLEMAFAAQGIDPQRSYKERMAREQQAQIVPDPVPLPPVETDEELQKISEIQEKEIDMPITDEMKQLTYRQEIGKNSTKIHHPTPTSGIAVGAGYDMKGRTSEEIIEDLTMAGVDADVAGQISKAAGLSGDEAKQFMKDNKGLGITEDQQLKLFDTVFANTVIRTQNQLRNMGYNPKDIPENKLILLVDYVYNTGSLFPKFTKAIIDNDYETAKKEYKRYSGDKELTRRNKATLSYIKELEKDTQIG